MAISFDAHDHTEGDRSYVWPPVSERGEHLGAWTAPSEPIPLVVDRAPTSEDYRKWAVMFAWEALQPAIFNPYGSWRPSLDERAKALTRAIECAELIADLVVYGGHQEASQPAESDEPEVPTDD